MTPPKETDAWKGTYFIDRYRVVDEIGVGGMASVYLARVDGAGGFQKWVAIKRIHPHLTEKEHVVSMFLDEARIAASISHPNVAQVFDLGQHEGGFWIAMEYLHGEPVREIYRHAEETGRPIDPRLVARIIADAADGLHAAHEVRGKDGQILNLVHRDVSPHNLFVTYDGVVKVVDFGIAKVAGRQIQTRVGVLRGKLAYMSPEQARCRPVDRRTDVFALGVVAWELLTGRRLFRGRNDLETVQNVLSCQIPRPSSISRDVPSALEAPVMRALERDPAKRFQTARDFARALQQFLVTTGQLVGPQEIGAFVSTLFHERIAMREAHLKWAAEVTQTLSLETLLPDGASSTKPQPRPAQPQGLEAHQTRSVAFDLVRHHPPEPPQAPGSAEWDLKTVPKGKAPAAPALPTDLHSEEVPEEEVLTEVGPTWGLEHDRVKRVAAMAPQEAPHEDRPPSPVVPPPDVPPVPRAPTQPVRAPLLQPPPLGLAAPELASGGPPPPPPLPALDHGLPASSQLAGPTVPWARYMVAAVLTFIIVAAIALTFVFVFRARIREGLGIQPATAASSSTRR